MTHSPPTPLTPDDDPVTALKQLVVDFRRNLEARAKAGDYYAPAAPLPGAPAAVSEPAVAQLTEPPEPTALVPRQVDCDPPGRRYPAVLARRDEGVWWAQATEGATQPATSGSSPADQNQPVGGLAPARLTLADVRSQLGDCTRCKLARGRNKIVFGVGAATAPLMFVGEAPGADEDRIGEPFVGRAGQLLDKMIAAMGWGRDTVYIANVLKCRPPGNRDPEPDEVEACQPFLARQIDTIAPRVIVTLGKPAAHLLLKTRAPISALRGRFQEFRGIRVMPTFHPAFLLRQPERKRETWSDLKQVISELDRLGVQAPNSSRA